MYRVTFVWFDQHGQKHETRLLCPTWGEADQYQRMPRLNGVVLVEFLPL